MLTCDAAGNWVASSCDDGAPCTTDACDAVANACKHKPIADGAACTGGACAAGVCKVKCTPGSHVGTHKVFHSVTNGWSSVVANATRIVVAHANQLSTSTIQYVAFDWSGKKLWELVPSTTAIQSSSALQLRADGSVVTAHRERASNNADFVPRLFSISAAGKLVKNVLQPTSPSGSTQIVAKLKEMSGGKWLAWGRADVQSKSAGYFVMKFDVDLNVWVIRRF